MGYALTRQHSTWFVIVVAIFITCLLIANIIAVKLVNIFGLIVPAGIIVFPISYICGDVLTEVYGLRRAHQVIWLGFVCNLLAVGAIYAGQMLPGADLWNAQAAYERILGFSVRLLIASFSAYLVGSLANAVILAWLKVVTGGRWLWLRTISSTIIGEGLDSLIFIMIAFWGILPLNAMLTAVVTQWLFKVVYEAAMTPITYLVINFLKRQEYPATFNSDTTLRPIVLVE